jgi:hypothetical protein
MEDSTDQNPTYEYTTPGTYTVELEATNADGSDTTTGTITVSTIVASFTSNVTCGDSGCNISFTDLSTCTPDAWNWSFGDGNYSSDQNPVHQFFGSGTFIQYDVNLSASRGGVTAYSNQTDYIDIPCQESFVVTLDQTYLDSGDSAYLPWQLYVLYLAITLAFFLCSIFLMQSAKFTAIIATVMFFLMAQLTWSIGFYEVAVEVIGTEIYLAPSVYAVHPPYLAILLYGFGMASLANCYYVWFRLLKEKAQAPAPSDPRPGIPSLDQIASARRR